MGQCYARPRLPGDYGLTTARNAGVQYEGAVFSLRDKAGPLSTEEQAIDSLLGPLFQLTLEARFGYQICLHVFTALTRVAKLCLAERQDGPPITVRLARLQDVAWGVEELLANFSSRGWLLRLVCTRRLDALVRWRLDDLAQLAAELAPSGSVEDSAADGTSSDAGSDAKAERQLALGLRSARKLQEALATHLPSVMAPHGGAGNPSAMESLMRRIIPLVQGGDDPLRQLELHDEVQIAVASLSVGPHRALRHPDLQYFWWRHMAGLEEVPWSTLWPHLATFLGNTPRLSDGAGDTGAALELLRSNELVRLLQSAVHRMGYANYVNAAELDMAFGSGGGSAGCMTLEEQLRVLLAPGRPILLARTSKGARAEGWAREAAAAATARHAALTAEASLSRRATTAAAAAVMAARQAAAFEGSGEEEERWYDAGSNFSRATSSTYMSVLGGGGDDASGIWPGRQNMSRPVSQVLLVAGGITPSNGSQDDSPPNNTSSRGPASRNPSGRETLAFRPSVADGRGSRRSSDRRLPAVGPALSRRVSAADVLSVPGPISGSRVEGEQLGRAVGSLVNGGTPEASPRPHANGSAALPEITPASVESVIAGRMGQQPAELLPRPHAAAGAAVGTAVDAGQVLATTDTHRSIAQAHPHGHPHPGPEASAATVSRLFGRDEEVRRLIDAIFSCTLADRDGISSSSAAAAAAAAANAGLAPFAPSPAAPGPTSAPWEGTTAGFGPASAAQVLVSPRLYHPWSSLPSLLLVTAPHGCGRTAVVTAAAERLVEAGVWNCASFADVRCAANPEEAALAMALALNVPFYAADRPAGARLLSWLRTYGPQLRQGLVLDNVDLLLGLGVDEALEVARSGSLASHDPAAVSAGGAALAKPSSLVRSPPGVPEHAGANFQSTPHRVTDPSAPDDVGQRRRRLLRLLRDVVLAAPGLRLVLISSPAVTLQLLQPALPQDLHVSFFTLGLLPLKPAAQLLRCMVAVRRTSATGEDSAAEQLGSQVASIVQACGHQPGLLRLAGRAVRCGIADISRIGTWADEALLQARSQHTPDESQAVDYFAAKLLAHAVAKLPPDARAVLCCLVALGCPLEEEDITAAAAFLGHPGLVRAGLCCLYDRGLLTYQELNQRHDVVGHVRRWMLRAYASSLVVIDDDPIVGPSNSSGSASAGSPKGHGRSPRSRSSLRAGHAYGGMMSSPPTKPAASEGGAPRSSKRSMGRFSSVGGGRATGVGGSHHFDSNGTGGSGITVRVLVQHIDGLLSQVSELYAHGCRVAALRVYNNGRGLADRALLLLPAWIRKAGPATSIASELATVLCRHINNICRHVLIPSQLARASVDLADLVPSLISPYDRLSSYVSAARAHVHLMLLPPAVVQLAAADSLALKLFPALGSLLESSRSREAQEQVAQLALAHAELAAASGQYDLAARHLNSFLELLAASGHNQSLEGAQAHMQLGDLCLRLARPPSEAAGHYDAAATQLMQLYGQGHFRVGRAMLAAARCSSELSLADAKQGGGSGGRAGGDGSGMGAATSGGGGAVAAAFRRGLSRRGTAAGAVARRPLEVQLQDCLYVQHLSQGKFNLDVAEVEVARGSALCRRNQPDEALSCGLVALGIVLEILGDGTPQVAECLTLIAQALRQKQRVAAAAAIMLHAHAVRLHAVAAIAAASDASNAAAVARPRPTESVVLDNLVEPALLKQLGGMASFGPHVAAAAAAAVPLPADELVSNAACGVGGVMATPNRIRLSPLQRSPIVQVPIPDSSRTSSPGAAAGVTPTGAARAPAPSPTGEASTSALNNADTGPPLSPMLRPSPRLVVLVPGEDPPAPSPRELAGVPLPEIAFDAQPPPPSPQIPTAASPVGATAGNVRHVPFAPPLAPVDSFTVAPSPSPSPHSTAASKGVRHVSYPPPLVPVDSMISPYSDAPALTPSPLSAAAAAAAMTPRGAGEASPRSAPPMSEPSSPEPRPATPPAGRAPAAAVSPSNDSPDEILSGLPMAAAIGTGLAAAIGTVSAVDVSPSERLASLGAGPFNGAHDVAQAALLDTDLNPAASTSLLQGTCGGSAAAAVASGPATRMSSITTDVWVDAPEEFPGGVGPEAVRLEELSTSAGAEIAPAGADVPAEVAEIAAATAAAATAMAAATTDVATRGGEGDVADAEQQPQKDEAKAESVFVLARRKPSLGGNAALPPVGPGGALQLPFPPPPLPPSAVQPGAAAAAAAAAKEADGWSTPVRARMSEPAVPHLHPSPLTLEVTHRTSVAGSTSTSPHPFSPDLCLPPPPPYASAAPPSLAAGSAVCGLVTSTAVVTATTTAAPNAAAAATNSAAGGGGGEGEASATPVAQLSYTAFSPNVSHATQDSRSHRGGIVFPSPTSTQGPYGVNGAAEQGGAPWLNWSADTGTPEGSSGTPNPRELCFTDSPTVNVSGIPTVAREGVDEAAAAAAAAVAISPSTPTAGDECAGSTSNHVLDGSLEGQANTEDLAAGPAPVDVNVGELAATSSLVRADDRGADGILLEAAGTAAGPNELTVSVAAAAAAAAPVEVDTQPDPVALQPREGDEHEGAADGGVAAPAGRDLPTAGTAPEPRNSPGVRSLPYPHTPPGPPEHTAATLSDLHPVALGIIPGTAAAAASSAAWPPGQAPPADETVDSPLQEAPPASLQQAGSLKTLPDGVPLGSEAPREGEQDDSPSSPAPLAPATGAATLVTEVLAEPLDSVPSHPEHSSAAVVSPVAAPAACVQPPVDVAPALSVDAVGMSAPAASAAPGEEAAFDAAVLAGVAAAGAPPVTEAEEAGRFSPRADVRQSQQPLSPADDQEAFQPHQLPQELQGLVTGCPGDGCGNGERPLQQQQDGDSLTQQQRQQLPLQQSGEEVEEMQPEEAALTPTAEFPPVEDASRSQPSELLVAIPGAEAAAMLVGTTSDSANSQLTAQRLEAPSASGHGSPQLMGQTLSMESPAEAAAPTDDVAARKSAIGSEEVAVETVACMPAPLEAGVREQPLAASEHPEPAGPEDQHPDGTGGGPDSAEANVIDTVTTAAAADLGVRPMPAALGAAESLPKVEVAQDPMHAPASPSTSPEAAQQDQPAGTDVSIAAVPHEHYAALPTGTSSELAEAVVAEAAGTTTTTAEVPGIPPGEAHVQGGEPSPDDPAATPESAVLAAVTEAADDVVRAADLGCQLPGEAAVQNVTSPVREISPGDSGRDSLWTQLEQRQQPAAAALVPMASEDGSEMGVYTEAEAGVGTRPRSFSQPDLLPVAAMAAATADPTAAEPERSVTGVRSFSQPTEALGAVTAAAAAAGDSSTAAGLAQPMAPPAPPASIPVPVPNGTPLPLSRTSSFATPVPKVAPASVTDSATNPAGAASLQRIPPPPSSRTTSFRSGSSRIPGPPSSTPGVTTPAAFGYSAAAQAAPYTAASAAVAAASGRGSNITPGALFSVTSDARARGGGVGAAATARMMAGGSAGATQDEAPSSVGWTLYSSPAFAMHDTSNSPRTDVEGGGLHDSHDAGVGGGVSSPAARIAGSYTAAYLMRQKRKSGASWGGAAGASGPTDAFPPNGDVVSPTDPRSLHGIKMHNPLFSTSPPRLRSGEIVVSSCEHEQETDVEGGDSSGDHHRAYHFDAIAGPNKERPAGLGEAAALDRGHQGPTAATDTPIGQGRGQGRRARSVHGPGRGLPPPPPSSVPRPAGGRGRLGSTTPTYAGTRRRLSGSGSGSGADEPLQQGTRNGTRTPGAGRRGSVPRAAGSSGDGSGSGGDAIPRSRGGSSTGEGTAWRSRGGSSSGEGERPAGVRSRSGSGTFGAVVRAGADGAGAGTVMYRTGGGYRSSSASSRGGSTKAAPAGAGPVGTPAGRRSGRSSSSGGEGTPLPLWR